MLTEDLFAAIDIGSNTIRMLIGKIAHGKVRPVIYSRHITRLKGGQTTRGLATDAMERTLLAMGSFQEELKQYSPVAISVVGTEALRTAANADYFLAQVKQQTGFDLQIISGAEEAMLSARGVLSVVDPLPETAIIVDIGGGSTEVVLTEQHEVIFRHSCPLGVVRLAEMQPRSSVGKFLDANLRELSSLLVSQNLLQLATRHDVSLIGTAGTITTLAALDLEMTTYDWRRVNNHRMPVQRLSEIERQLAALNVSQREQLPGMEKGRGDLILPGLTVLDGLMKIFARQELVVSDFGLLEGLLMHMADTSAIH